MAVVTRHVRAGVEEVFAAISDPRTYPLWLVGAREIRSVDADWPAVGSRFHHRVGLVGPLTVADSTEVLAIDPPRSLTLEVRARPAGRGRVVFTLEVVDGDGRGPITRITMDEVPIGLLTPTRPLAEGPTRTRNEASLNAFVAYLNDPTAAPVEPTGQAGGSDTG